MKRSFQHNNQNGKKKKKKDLYVHISHGKLFIFYPIYCMSRVFLLLKQLQHIIKYLLTLELKLEWHTPETSIFSDVVVIVIASSCVHFIVKHKKIKYQQSNIGSKSIKTIKKNNTFIYLTLTFNFYYYCLHKIFIWLFK